MKLGNIGSLLPFGGEPGLDPGWLGGCDSLPSGGPVANIFQYDPVLSVLSKRRSHSV